MSPSGNLRLNYPLPEGLVLFGGVGTSVGGLSCSVEFARSLPLTGGVSYIRGKQFAKPEAGLPGGNIAEMPPLKSRAALRYGRSRFESRHPPPEVELLRGRG